MFVISVKTGYRQILAVLGCLAVLTVAIVLSVCGPKPLYTAADVQGSDSAGRIAYLRAKGFTVDETSEQVREVRIPDEPDEALLQYVHLQEEAGRLLEDYYGKRVKVYSYDIGESDTARLYIYRDRVIAGDVTVDGDIQVIKGEE